MMNDEWKARRLSSIHHSSFRIHHFITHHSSFIISFSESGALENLEHHGGAPGLRDEEPDDAGGDLGHHVHDVSVAREHDAEAFRVSPRGLAQEGRAAYLRHREVADDHVERALVERAPRLGERRRRANLVVVPEGRAEDFEAGRLVVEVKYRKLLLVSHLRSPQNSGSRSPSETTRWQAPYRGGCPPRARSAADVARAVQKERRGNARWPALLRPQGQS